jgi:polyphosphate kinase
MSLKSDPSPLAPDLNPEGARPEGHAVTARGAVIQLGVAPRPVARAGPVPANPASSPPSIQTASAKRSRPAASPIRDASGRRPYEEEKARLQAELLKVQIWAQETGQKFVILFEGRDAAGKGGTIKRFTEHLNPRFARVVALNKPTEPERGQWFFQRYVQHLPTAGEMVFYDRSWYNRAGVERVMGFCSPVRVSGIHAPGA